jgi:hypothetical protein
MELRMETMVQFGKRHSVADPQEKTGSRRGRVLTARPVVFGSINPARAGCIRESREWKKKLAKIREIRGP